MQELFFFHGLNGSPQGIKSQYLRSLYPEILIPLFSPDLEERLGLAKSLLRRPAVLIGSSLGGVTALQLADIRPNLVKGLLLLAPAVGLKEPNLITEAEAQLLKGLRLPLVPCIIVLAKRDLIVSPEAIRALAERAEGPVMITEADDDHGLNQSLPLIGSLLEKLLKEL
ncbi:MAG: hypothetical protein A2527_11025 [Candidatus Lambdaproteobacteria bacterium RIFOXYD2_FULL_50_16]|uniref:Serine aminopeptidase S33 domain-containing protein n=1 Tax=Candidatus Lambdaproteobacteria bacterium RIFOXYD2_FULL_50_16 TaxID=1817772 RepID=A0A1F6G6B3_9PROT|nr:MAG: hypothetical protein A2527_11025 [Candidatus Lambdaproteobacteria bacterium RIFOXYD2_FULL_50_16]